MEYTVEKTISLIHIWLKENHLLKTCRSLQEEYGKAIPEPEGTCSLQNIVRTYQAVFTIVSSMQQTIKETQVPKEYQNGASSSDNKKKSKSKGTKKSTENEGGSRNQNNLSSKDGNASAKSSGNGRRQKNSRLNDANSSTENEEKVSSINSNKKAIAVKKKEKQPFMPKGEWVCPEMEDILCNVYDRLIIINGLNTHQVPQVESSPKSTNNGSARNDNTKNHKIEMNVGTLHATNKVASKVVQDVNMFTSDSESDSGDNLQPTAIQLCNDVMLVSANQSDHMQEVVPQKIIVDNSVENNIKKNVKKNEKQPVELDEIKVKKKKAKMLLPNISPVFECHGASDLQTKKKKKRKFSDFEDTYNGTAESNSEVQTGVEKKRKKHKPNCEDIHNSVINDNFQIPVKNGKKAKLEAQGKENILGVELIKKKKQKYLNSEEVVNEIILNNLSETLKKKKKKKY